MISPLLAHRRGSLGIEKGKEFKPDAAMTAELKLAAQESPSAVGQDMEAARIELVS